MGQRVSSVHDAVRLLDVSQLETSLTSEGSSWDVNELKDGRTALIDSICEQKNEVVLVLLRHGADVNKPCIVQGQGGHEFSWTAMHEACRLGNVDIVKSLLAAPAACVNLTAHHQMRPLHVAAWHGHHDVIQVLLQTGDCDVNVLDQFQESAIVLPICTGDTSVVELLLSAGCKLNSRAWGNLRKISGKHDCDFRDHLYGRDGPYSLFTLAIKFSWLNTARLLLRHGFNANRYELYDILALVKENTGSMDSEDAQLLIRCLFQAGYRVRGPLSVQRVVELCQQQHVYVDWLQKKVEQPDSLKELCRTSIRAYLRVLGAHTSILGRIDKTGLPKELREYVALAEFFEAVNAGALQDDNRQLLYFAMPRRRDRGTKAVTRPSQWKTKAKTKHT